MHHMAEMRTQDRLAAILAADVVGYSRMMEQDEAGTMALLKSRRKDVLKPLVAEHQGRVFKFIRCFAAVCALKTRLFDEAQIGPGRLPSRRKQLFGIVVGDGTRDDDVFAVPPVRRRGDLVLGS
jgi:class 3 adenylate cyclase